MAPEKGEITMKKGLAVVTMVLGAIVAVAGIASAVISVINLQLGERFDD